MVRTAQTAPSAETIHEPLVIAPKGRTGKAHGGFVVALALATGVSPFVAFIGAVVILLGGQGWTGVAWGAVGLIAPVMGATLLIALTMAEGEPDPTRDPPPWRS